MASDFDRACQAVEYLYDMDHGTASMAYLEALPEELSRRAFAFHGRRPPQYFEILWAAPKIAHQLMQGHACVAFLPTGTRPLTWTAETRPRRIPAKA